MDWSAKLTAPLPRITADRFSCCEPAAPNGMYDMVWKSKSRISLAFMATSTPPLSPVEVGLIPCWPSSWSNPSSSQVAAVEGAVTAAELATGPSPNARPTRSAGTARPRYHCACCEQRCSEWEQARCVPWPSRGASRPTPITSRASPRNQWFPTHSSSKWSRVNAFPDFPRRVDVQPRWGRAQQPRHALDPPLDGTRASASPPGPKHLMASHATRARAWACPRHAPR
eukprot:scaffold88403_cov28-Tisochrysis_lutea.AAC.3